MKRARFKKVHLSDLADENPAYIKHFKDTPYLVIDHYDHESIDNVNEVNPKVVGHAATEIEQDKLFNLIVLEARDTRYIVKDLKSLIVRKIIKDKSGEIIRESYSTVDDGPVFVKCTGEGDVFGSGGFLRKYLKSGAQYACIHSNDEDLSALSFEELVSKLINGTNRSGTVLDTKIEYTDLKCILTYTIQIADDVDASSIVSGDKVYRVIRVLRRSSSAYPVTIDIIGLFLTNVVHGTRH